MHDVWIDDDELRHDAELGRQSSDKYEGSFLRVENRSEDYSLRIQRRYFELEYVASDHYARYV